MRILIEISNLSYSYGANKILEHISFSVRESDYIGIIGPNGGGKTTLLKILLGLLRPQEGTVKIFDKSTVIGYVPQRIAQENMSFPATVYEVVESGRTPQINPFGRLNKQDHLVIEEALKAARIERFRNKLLNELSGGERQRVYVARALTSKPKILMLDEPFVGIDVSAQEDFYAFLRQLNEKQKLTILFVSHDIDVISQEVKEIVCLNKRLVCSGSPKQIQEENIIEKLYGKKITHIHHQR
ncbi:metal ABC transporter ATP-binding protein [Candidatus Roizmanbacteria bacterium]|nr:metal ABC transporter ATP-binding protein [Candidatus Roizmanbacteria bacterium]